MIERRRFGIHLSSHTCILLTKTFWSTSVSFILPWHQIWHAKIIGHHLIFCHLKPCYPVFANLTALKWAIECSHIELENWTLNWVRESLIVVKTLLCLFLFFFVWWFISPFDIKAPMLIPEAVHKKKFKILMNIMAK